MKNYIFLFTLVFLNTLTFAQRSTNQLKLSQTGQQIKNPMGLKLKTPQSFAEVLECFPGAITSHPSTNYTSAITSSADPTANYLVATKLEDIPMTMSGLFRVWGLRLYWDGYTWSECFENPLELEFGFWENDSGEPGALIYSFTSQVVPTDIGEYFPPFPIWQWDVNLPANVCLTGGWFTVQSTANNTNCWWLWLDAPDYPGIGLQKVGGVWNQTDFPFGYCFSGWNSLENDVGISSIVSPSSGQNLGFETVEVIVTNEGVLPQSGFPLFFTVNNGSPVIEAFPVLINGGESLNYTFSQTADLSTVGSYDIEACTDLNGDQNPYNNCTTKTVVHEPPPIANDLGVLSIISPTSPVWNQPSLSITSLVSSSFFR